MTQTNNRLIDEIARLATDAAAVAQGARREVEGAMRSQVERLLSEANVVQRDDFEAVKAIAVRAADEVDALRARVEALEAKLSPPAPAESEAPDTGHSAPGPQ
ncbi:pyrroline-5-carboxylate reductase [Acuticoccus sediminis]|uniref:Pyrroline-5-carboxylate reductase n=1 Tax=Acuticoccus sediminis TaxID=2184697 RepID=A0A8B2NK83_9HYPH|nr:accessory factor UbiK family protein [Acuticoccus sediminis]RAH98897.1 pyrroline-5-carboxylate reductase [Acuticoccus sediminis]